MNSIAFGDVEVTRVEEWAGGFGLATDVLPDSRPADWTGNQDLLVPQHWDPKSGMIQCCIQTFVLRSEGRTILIDTGAGNGKDRPNVPPLNRLETDFLDRLANSGVQPEEVDVVICTHLHVDHVGWNTVPHDGNWVPTFPRAKYLFNSTELRFWNLSSNPVIPKGAPSNVNVFEDSVAPIVNAGQAVVWDDRYEVDSNLTLELTPGHTPGMAVVKLSSGGEDAVFVADLLHSPLQLLRPSLSCFSCEDPDRAVASRNRILSWAADHNALVIPAHFSEGIAAEVQRSGNTVTLRGLNSWGSR